jgi:hypothetical protein
MLQTATPTKAEVGTTRLYPVIRGVNYLIAKALVVAAVTNRIPEPDILARKAALDQNGLTIQVRNAPAVVGQALHMGGIRFGG